MRFSDDCYNCRDCIVIDTKSYKRKLSKLVCYPIRMIQRLFVRDLEEREFAIESQIQKLDKFKNINVDAINADTFTNLEKYVNKMQNKINKLKIPEGFTEEFQFIFDLKHDLKEFEKHWGKIKKLNDESGDYPETFSKMAKYIKKNGWQAYQRLHDQARDKATKKYVRDMWGD